MKPQLRQVVVYTDPKGADHDALVTAVWSDTCINLVYVSDDESKRDDYGRQIQRQTSVTHASGPGQAHGNYWRFPGQEKNPVKPPVAV